MASEWDKVSGLGLGASERWPFPEGKTSISDYPRRRLNGFLLWGERLQDTGWSNKKKDSYHGVLRLCIPDPSRYSSHQAMSQSLSCCGSF